MDRRKLAQLLCCCPPNVRRVISGHGGPRHAHQSLADASRDVEAAVDDDDDEWDDFDAKDAGAQPREQPQPQPLQPAHPAAEPADAHQRSARPDAVGADLGEGSGAEAEADPFSDMGMTPVYQRPKKVVVAQHSSMSIWSEAKQRPSTNSPFALVDTNEADSSAGAWGDDDIDMAGLNAETRKLERERRKAEQEKRLAQKDGRQGKLNAMRTTSA